jgi:hypothetical protein
MDLPSFERQATVCSARRLIVEMMTGATPLCDPAPYAAERFTRR